MNESESRVIEGEGALPLIVDVADSGLVTFAYLPHQDLFGTPLDSFSFRLERLGLLSNAANVTLDVAPVNDAPRVSVSVRGGELEAARDGLVLVSASLADELTLTFNVTDPDAAHLLVLLNASHALNFTLSENARQAADQRHPRGHSRSLHAAALQCKSAAQCLPVLSRSLCA